VAASKAVEELLDRAVEKGTLSFPLLRDAVARNQAKLSDLGHPRDLVRDALLRMDRDLAAPLEGVYRRAEIYRRWLHRLSAVLFGTRLGRWLTLLVLLPAAGAFVVLEGLQHTVVLLVEKLAHVEVHLVTAPAMVALSAFLLALLNAAWARSATLKALRALGRGLRWLFIGAPGWVLARPWARRFLESAAWRAVRRWLIGPALFAALFSSPVWFFALDRAVQAGIAVGLYVAAALFLNSSAGRRFEEAATDGLVRARRWLAHRFFAALIQWILAFFRALVEGLERVLYAVDEWLRFRPGDRALSIAAKAVLGLPLGAASYVVRFYVNVLIEPKYNPVKHFPVVTVGHKIILPLSFQLTDAFSRPLLAIGLPATAAKTIAGISVFLTPGLFGFLAWELKENWRLYRSNRPAHLGPVVVGSHGENIVRLLRPGFHSGTLPKIFARLRRATRRNNARALHKQEEALHHVALELRRFVERELVALVGARLDAATPRLQLTDVAIGSNRIRFELAGALAIVLEEQSRWLVGSARIGEPVAHLPPADRQAIEDALAGFYHLCGVDILREEIEARLPAATPYDIADEGLTVWPGPGYASEVVYPLRGEHATLVPRTDHAEPSAPALVPLSRRELFLRARPLRWEEWRARWERGCVATDLAQPGTGAGPQPADPQAGAPGM
jgi:hypothetical protein